MIRHENNKEKLRNILISRGEQYSKEYEMIERNKIEQRRAVKQQGYYLEEECPLLFVIRLRGVNGVPPKPRKILELFRLLQINNGVFLKVNQATKQMLQMIVPYVAFGTPSLKSVHDLIYKRGYGKVHKQRIPLSSNEIIQNNLGQYNIVCMEDLVHEIYTIGPHFKEANQFLWPFKLSPPSGGFNSVVKGFNEGGDLGNRENFINDLIKRML